MQLELELENHLEPCQNPISGHGDTMSVYPDIGPDIGPDIADTRYRVFPDIGYPDIGYDPISGITISGITISGHTRYQDIPISGPMSRYRVSRLPDIESSSVPMSCILVTISGHCVSRYRTRCLLFPAVPGPRAGLVPAFRLLPSCL